MPYLYVIRSPSGLRKVGSSIAPLARARQLSTINTIDEAGTFTLEYQRECPDPAVDAEKHAQALLAPARVRLKREYFQVGLEMATAAVDAAIDAASAGEPLMKPPPSGRTERFEMRVSDKMIEQLDCLRRLESDMPTRSEMLRRLVDRLPD